MNERVMPAEAIEAAAKVYNSKCFEATWEALPDWAKESRREDTRDILAAAAPNLLADYLLTLAADVRARGDIGKDDGLESWDYLAWKAEQLRTTK